jgi:hypothetical protein
MTNNSALGHQSAHESKGCAIVITASESGSYAKVEDGWRRGLVIVHCPVIVHCIAPWYSLVEKRPVKPVENICRDKHDWVDSSE